MTDAVETMAYAGEMPWHGLGTQVEGLMTSEEAMVAAELNWEVKVGRLYGGKNSKYNQEYEDYKSIYRESDGKPLGVCLGRFTPVQNREMFDFMDSLVQDGVLKYETAGSLKGGRRIWMLAQAQELGLQIAGKDTFNAYLLGVNGHDNLLSLRVFPTFVRVVCNNTLELALNERGKRMNGGIMLRHIGNMQAKLATAKKVLDVTTNTQRRMGEWLKIAADTKVTDEQFAACRTAVFGALDDESPKQRQDTIAKFMAIYAEETARVGDTAYAMLNAITGFADHGKEQRGEGRQKDEAHFNSILLDTGTANTFKTRGLDALVTFTDLPKLEDVEVKVPEVFTMAMTA